MHSLRFKLLAPFMAGTLILTLVLAWYTYNSARMAVKEAILLISEAKTGRAASSMTLFFKSVSTAMQNMVVDPHVTSLFSGRDTAEALAKTNTWLAIMTQSNEHYRDILIVDKSGICLASSNPGHVGSSYASKEYAQKALAGIFHLGEPTVGRVTKTLSIAIAGPVDTAQGVVGALVLINDLPKIVDYESGAVYDTQVIFTSLLTPEGEFMAHKDKNLMGSAHDSYAALYAQLASVGERGGSISYELRGDTYVGFARVERSSGWLVITGGKESEVFAPAYRVGLTVLGISLVFALIVSLVVGRYANGILNSLLHLVRYAKEVSEGDLYLQLAETKRDDELGTLHNALKRLVRALQDMLRETQEASRMKGQFLANMSHEIRTPLNAIIGMGHLSLRDADLLPRQRDYLEKILLAAKSLLGLINDILDLSKVEAGMLVVENLPFDLEKTLQSSLDIYQETARSKGLSLTLEYDSSAPRSFLGDHLRISQVLNNLISNALKFTASGGITVTCGQGPPRRREEPPRALPAEATWEDLPHAEQCDEEDPPVIMWIRVADTGIGIAPEVIPTLFQPFTQADATITRKFGGTGLGLAISHRLVALMGGEFILESEPGKGSTFAFSVRLQPVDAEQNAGREGVAASFAGLKLDGKRVLVAEDNEINQFIIGEMIAPSGAEVVLAGNGQEAVDAVLAQDFDLVLMDMQMPVMDGIEATRILRGMDRGRELPIIAVTANAMEEDRERGVAIGMNDYLTKPIEPERLLKVLRTWLADTSGEETAS